MAQPIWDDPGFDAGVMVKGALWLVQRVGPGNVFTKNDIREAFPDIAQADRRIRDLRDYGWVLHTRADDASLLQEQTRFVKAGVEVWDPRARRAGNPRKGISPKAREEVMARDGYVCTTCGIAGGEEYPDDPTQTAVLAVMKEVMVLPDGGTRDALATTCKRCKAGRGSGRATVARLLAAARELGDDELAELVAWMRCHRRLQSPVERAWGLYLSLPPEGRDEIRSALEA